MSLNIPYDHTNESLYAIISGLNPGEKDKIVVLLEVLVIKHFLYLVKEQQFLLLIQMLIILIILDIELMRLKKGIMRHLHKLNQGIGLRIELNFFLKMGHWR